VVLLLALLTPAARGGVYSPDEPCPFQIDPDGTAKPLPFRQFLLLYVDRETALAPPDPAKPVTLDWYPTDDGSGLRAGPACLVTQRLLARWPKADRLTGPDLAGYTADLIRLGGSNRAVGRLQSEKLSRNPNYLLLANLIHAQASTSDWNSALGVFAFALDYDPPTALPGTRPEQLKWQYGVDRKHYRLWLRHRQDDAEKKPPVKSLVPDAVFEDTDRKPIRFWETDAEAAKLPADAVAVAQQLALWSPGDVRLQWLLAEVYLATGDPRSAQVLFDRCADAGRFTGPTVFRDHRAEAHDLVAKLPKDTPEVPAAAAPGDAEQGLFAVVDERTFYVVGGLFAAGAVVLLAFQFRVIARRLGRENRP
jgi:hypothetical protein